MPLRAFIDFLSWYMDVTAIGSMPDRIAALEAKAAEWLV